MAAINSVDLVTLFEEDTPIDLIRLLRPDFLIKGADDTIATVAGAHFVAFDGGRVVLVPQNTDTARPLSSLAQTAGPGDAAIRRSTLRWSA